MVCGTPRELPESTVFSMLSDGFDYAEGGPYGCPMRNEMPEKKFSKTTKILGSPAPQALTITRKYLGHCGRGALLRPRPCLVHSSPRFAFLLPLVGGLLACFLPAVLGPFWGLWRGFGACLAFLLALAWVSGRPSACPVDLGWCPVAALRPWSLCRVFGRLISCASLCVVLVVSRLDPFAVIPLASEVEPCELLFLRAVGCLLSVVTVSHSGGSGGPPCICS